MTTPSVWYPRCSEQKGATMMTPGRGLAAALLLVVACERGSGTAHDGAQPSEHPPPDAPQLWLHPEGERRSRIILVTAGGAIFREWRFAEVLDEKTRDEVKAALDGIAPPSHAVEIRVRKDVMFMTLKCDMPELVDDDVDHDRDGDHGERQQLRDGDALLAGDDRRQPAGAVDANAEEDRDRDEERKQRVPGPGPAHRMDHE